MVSTFALREHQGQKKSSTFKPKNLDNLNSSSAVKSCLPLSTLDNHEGLRPKDLLTKLCFIPLLILTSRILCPKITILPPFIVSISKV